MTAAAAETPDSEGLPTGRPSIETSPGNYVDTDDIRRAEHMDLEICEVIPPNTVLDGTGKLIGKPIIGFRGARKKWIVNQINLRCLALLLGRQPDEWPGKRVRLCVRWLEFAFGQRNVPVVRVQIAESELSFSMREAYGRDRPFPERQSGSK